ncbi:MAG: acyl-CoA thioesterase [Ottowia sp.]|nr:acyl-CoA thioesterase [Ottowia sp.]
MSISHNNKLPPLEAPERANVPGEQPPQDHELVLRMVAMPSDANVYGNIFGGWLMAQADVAAAILPARVAQGRIVTVAFNNFLFKQPVHPGDLLSFYARMLHVGNSSMTVHIGIYAEYFTRQGQFSKVAETTVTYVAIDEYGNPRPVPRQQQPHVQSQPYMPPMNAQENHHIDTAMGALT